jgi:hypothetical protein
MKTIIPNTWMPVCASLFMAALAFQAAADQAATPLGSEKSFRGTVVSIDANERLLHVKGWLILPKAFNLGNNCVYSGPGNDNTTANMLRPGEKVEVNYQDSHGVLIADRVEQVPMRVAGMVTALDAINHTLTLQKTALNKQLQLPDDCQIVLRDGKPGALADIKIGDQGTVTYETPDNVPTARQVAQTSLEFAGTLTAVDLEDRTIKAKAMFASKKFNLAADCAIIVNGQPNGRMADLRPDERLVLSYDQINGVNVVNRIAPQEPPANHVAASGPAPGF